VASVCPVLDRFLGNSHGDALLVMKGQISWLKPYEQTFRSQFHQLICRFVTSSALMTQHPYQLNSILFGQLHEGLMAVPDQF
jgi:hypothetical protein